MSEPDLESLERLAHSCMNCRLSRPNIARAKELKRRLGFKSCGNRVNLPVHVHQGIARILSSFDLCREL